MSHSPRAASRERAAHLGPERRRPQVLDAALHLAVRDGLGAVTFGTVANELGVTRSVVYACFRDRVEMLSELLDREQTALVDGVLAALHASGVGREPHEAFADGFTALFESVLRRPDAWRLMLFSSEPDAAVSARMKESRALVTRQATAWIRPALERWWQTEDLDRKLPVLIQLFMANCEAGVQLVLEPTDDWTAPELGAFVGGAVARMFAEA